MKLKLFAASAMLSAVNLFAAEEPHPATQASSQFKQITDCIITDLQTANDYVIIKSRLDHLKTIIAADPTQVAYWKDWSPVIRGFAKATYTIKLTGLNDTWDGRFKKYQNATVNQKLIKAFDREINATTQPSSGCYGGGNPVLE